MRIFDYLKKRALLARIAAELKAQCHDQNLVNEVCYSIPGVHITAELADGRFRVKNRLREFMIVTFLLAETICVIGVPITIKEACFELLSQRRARIQSLIDSGAGDGELNESDIVDLDQISDLGMQFMWSERREHLASSLMQP
ncbi:hypothetical protein CXB40_31240 [Pseudomonas syringae pv. avii]|uniref:hypothetical protein n=1 Tax=Pseudomonas syringae TaxID=317 RepID=UPI000CDAF0C1|nr:hypothetical protein [Pseudomonas syringae]POP85846.1 hypothetical protein CXB40_31240 [Pseudomonas syringae pv. avii]